MKMAEHDWEIRESKACVRVLTLLESTITNVVDLNQLPPNFDDLQFEMFEVIKNKKLKYYECREMVEMSCQLLFAFHNDVKVDLALELLSVLKEHMRIDESPTSIYVNLFQLLTKHIDKYTTERIISTFINFVQQFIVEGSEPIVYI